MSGNENYEELKWTIKGVLQWITSHNFYYGIFLLVLMIIIVKLIDLVFKPLRKSGRKRISLDFVKWVLKALVIITMGMKIISLSQTLSGFYSQILMSSSLIVVVLGFVFQEGLSNLVHGVILAVFQPFKIGDRVHVNIDGESITGYIQSIDLRSTIVQNVINSSHVIVPNSKMDLSVIDNQYFGKNQISSNFLDLSITYESDLERAISILMEEVESHPLVHQFRADNNITTPVMVMVRNLGESGIDLRASVTTLTVEDNFLACSDIRRSLVRRFKQEPAVEFAYPHMHVVKDE